MKLTIGADPELFVFSKGQLISGHTFPCGSKETPLPVANGHVQNDGMALEFNVPPSETKKEFVNNTIKVLKDLTKLVKETDPNASLKAIPVADFGEEVIKNTPEFYAQLGCNPDFNAYTKQANPMPNASMPFRTGSGHIHVGWTEGADTNDNNHMALCCDLVKELDYYLGLPSLLWDPDNRRRDLYGKAGAFRPKPYGVEYRVMSNAWLKRPDLMEFVFDRTIAAVRSVFLNKRRPLSQVHGLDAREIINGAQGQWMQQHWPEKRQKIASRVLNDQFIGAMANA